jgi:hypothetical protein
MARDLRGESASFTPLVALSAGIGGFQLIGGRESISGIINYSHLQYRFKWLATSWQQVLRTKL